MAESLTNLDLYLDYDPGTVVDVERVEDVNCGMNPVYYRRDGDSLKVSTSALSLISDAGTLDRNPDFAPPDFLSQPTPDEVPPTDSKLDEIGRYVLRRAAQTVKPVLSQGPVRPWYVSWQTIDSRVFKLRPFETVDASSRESTFEPTYSLSNAAELADRVATALRDFVHRIERQYPDHHHVVLTGGRDSQLIHLVPKSTDDWHVFTAEPTAKVVRQFVAENDVQVRTAYEHDNRCRESVDDIREKVACSDLYSDPRHVRWLPKLRDIADSFDGDCIFWVGTEGDTFFSHHAGYHAGSREAFFRLHQSRAPSWQGNFHQTASNFVGAPFVSPYHSPEMWRDVFVDYDPKVIEPGDDVRPIIGRRLVEEGTVSWPDSNPSPSKYAYPEQFSSEAMYTEELRRSLE